MATTTDNKAKMSKSAARAGLWLSPLTLLSKDNLTAYLATVAALGAAGGAGVGAAASYIKSKNPKIVALDRKKEFYDKKIREMENENWLNDIMTAKKKLESSKLSDEERAELEKKYIKLLNS